MPTASGSIDQLVTALVPSLSRSLAEQFNVFRVMHHGTHEKQLSNVFAWLLRVDGTHGLGDAFQRIFAERMNTGLPTGSQLPTSGYRVLQEVDTLGHDAVGRDIADIVLTNPLASIVVENFESSDGHGHDYDRYLAYGGTGGKPSVVVLLCARREPRLQTGGWEQAVVVTYAELLEDLQAHVAGAAEWRRKHPQQHFFVNQVFEHFLEGSGAVSSEDRIAFLKIMCETGESARYGHRPQKVAAQEFAEQVALHAERQFEDGRRTLAAVKTALKQYAQRTLVGQLNEALPDEPITHVVARYVGRWEWCAVLVRDSPQASINLDFGPTAVVENGLVPEPVRDPDYTKVFVTRQGPAGGDSIDRIVQTDVGIEEVLAGLSGDDNRLRDAVLALVQA